MTDALYQELILDHNRKPRNFRVMENADRQVEGHNPLCGDQLTLWLKMDGDRIADVSFITPPGVGCAISKASASLMTSTVKGKTRVEAEAIFEKFHDLVMGKLDEAQAKELGSLRAFGGVSKFPMRVKCASLAWHSLHSALEGGGQTVSTEGEGPADSLLEGA
jgi:nitrogen fixation NifU-like protein